MAIDPLLFAYKGNRCAGCGLTVEEMLRRYGVVNKIFQFNHIDPERKHSEYDKLIQRVVSTEQLDEIDKCALLCNICHDVLHAQSVAADVKMSVAFAGKVVEQKIRCQGIINVEKGHIQLFSDDDCSLTIYAVGFPPEEPEFMADLELKEDGRMLDLLLKTESGKKLLIWREDQTLLVRAVRHSEAECRISASTAFPFFKFDNCLSDTGERFWIRNRRMIVRSKNPVKYSMTESPRTFHLNVAYNDLRKGLEEQRRKVGDLAGHSSGDE